MHRKAFTLIELLVVIAIIAILAAILFPVFAQAKSAAKDSVALNEAKQLGLGVLMYSNDSDDQFPLIIEVDSQGDFDTWQGFVQPYIKNYGIFVHPKLPAPPSDTNSAAYFYQVRAHWGMPLKGTSNLAYVAPSSSSAGTYNYTSKSQTGGLPRVFDGIAGAGIDPSQAGQIAAYATGPSLSDSSIARPSDTIMVTEAGGWDMNWGLVGAEPMNEFIEQGVWKDPTWNVEPLDYCGPHSRKSYQTFSGYGAASTTLSWPDGRTTFVATDGSAHSIPWQGGVTAPLDLGNGTTALKVLWPSQ